MSDFVLADTEYGKVKGVKKISALNTAYNAFLGIRYATPPTGELRFKDPLPPAKWDEIYDATEERSGCYEMNTFVKKITGSEDGLFLNIFTKNIKPQKLQPVMVFLYGGAFQSGSSTTKAYGPDYLLMADVVVVTINYRVGALGFLSLKDKELNVPGNAGLKDQLMAMKFVNNNIQNFGGDPNNITLFGHSAGGGSVSWHCVSEKSKGFFNRAIIMSGCVLNKFSLTPHRDWANRLARKLGYEGSEDESDVLEFLQQADSVAIVKVQDNLLQPEDKGKVSYAFAPSIEHYETENTFNCEQPIDLVRKTWSNSIDIMIGSTSDEGLMFLEYINAIPAMLKMFKLESMIPAELNLSDNDPRRSTFVEKLRRAYYPFGTDPSEDVMAFCRLKGEQFLHGMQRIIQSRQHSGGSGKTFVYRFAVDSPTQNHYRNARLGPEVRGVSHGDEISYLFKNIHVNVPARDSMEFQAIQRFVSYFTSFATTGNPNDNVINANIESVHWSPTHSLDPPFKCMNIGEDLEFLTLPESERLAVWDAMYIESNSPLY